MARAGSMQSLHSLDTVRQLLNLAEHGNIATIQSFLDQGGDVDITDEEDNTVLQMAAANGHEQLVRLLLMRGAALDKANVYGWTPLMHAARYGHRSVVALLIQSKADINARNRWGVSVLMVAARAGHLQTSKMLVEAGIDLSPSSSIGCSACEFTPLMAAAQYGHDSVVRYLLDRGSDINYRTPSMGVNSLMFASLNGHMTTSQILIERDADPDLTNVNSHTPLEIATLQGKREVRGYLDRKTKNKPVFNPEDVKPDIIEVAKRGDYLRMREILDEDISQRNACSPQDGATPLMFTAMMGRLDMVQLLVEKGCDINKQDSVSGWTALMQATYHGKRLVAKYLISMGADVLIPAKNGCTAFDMACLIDDVDTELYRLLASKAVTVSKGKGFSGKQNGSATLPGKITIDLSEDQPKSGLKAWWGRMSNRFRNLKLGRTFTNRLSPLPMEDAAMTDSSLKRSSSTNDQTVDTGPVSPTPELNKSVSVDTGLDSTVASNVSYETIMLETKKSASMALYTLGITAQNNNLLDGTLKPVLPPFFPPPTYETDRPKMPPVSTRRSLASLGSPSTMVSRPIMPMKFLQTYASNQSLSASPTGNKASPSPNSSGGASGISSTMGRSSASSSTLTTGSDHITKHGLVKKSHHRSSDSVFISSHPHPSQVYMPSGRPRAATTFMKSSHISPNSSTSESSSLTPRKPGKSVSSRGSTNSTLTPSPSPTPKAADESNPSSGSRSASSQHKNSSNEEDELGGILKKLSLEKYQPIFEEQEVDMEAFLTLTDTDLKDLGISKNEPRVQILTAISELQTGKGRERLHFHETMTQFQSTLSGSSRSSFSSAVGMAGVAGAGLGRWNLPSEEGQINPENSAKSRSS